MNIYKKMVEKMFSKLVRLGKDAELAVTPSGKNVCKITAAYDIGWGDNKKTVWIDASWWGDRPSKIAQYLTKGTQIVIHADDVEPDAFEGRNGLSTKLKMNITNVELVPKPKQEGNAVYQQSGAGGTGYQLPAQQPVQNAASGYSNAIPAQQYQQSQQPNIGFEDFDDSIPF